MKFVVRVLDGDHDLLGWATVGDVSIARGLVRAATAVSIPIERSGTASAVSIHWTDLDVARLVRVPATEVTAGSVVTWTDPLWAVVGEADVPLPAVTVRHQVNLAPSTGVVGARAGV